MLVARKDERGGTTLNRIISLAGTIVLAVFSTANGAAQTAPFSGKLTWPQALPPNPDTAIVNSVRVGGTGATLADQPLIVSRYFRKGEITGFPQAYAGGTAIPTQADVKTRWDDGSVQHAILSLRVSVSSATATEIVFKNAAGALTGASLSAEQMLSSAFDFGATMELTTATGTHIIDIREMVRAGAFRYWLAGPVTTQIIVEDATPANAFDVEFNGYKSFHPIFLATFHPGQRSVKIDFIGENAWIDRLQDVTYSLVLRTGNPLRAAVYEKASYVHYASSRWRKTAYSGDPVTPVTIDHNLPYLIQSGAIPNMDLSVTVLDSAISTEYNQYLASDQGDLGGRGAWVRAFGTTGGRGELGVFPRWDVRYLYTFKPEMETVSRANAAVSAYVPIHYRESSSGRGYHASLPGVDAYGRMVSIDARPGFCSRTATQSLAKDAAVNVGPVTRGGWEPDVAHQGSFTYISYLTTGDYFFLEEMYAWAAWNLSYSNPGTCGWCRGGDPTKGISWGFVHPSTNTRAYGWVLRNLAHAAVLAPDNSPEKAYFTDKLLNNISVLEGRFGVEGGFVAYDPSRQPMYQHGREALAPNVPNPLRIWEYPSTTNFTSSTLVLAEKTYYLVSPWMHHIIFANLGHVDELGLPVSALRRDVMKNLLGQIKDPGYNPYLTEAYHAAATGAKGMYYSTWQQVRDAFEPTYRDHTTWEPARIMDGEFGYGYIAMAAASYLGDVEWNGIDGNTGVDWLWQNYPRNRTALSSNPKWSQVPRATAVTGSLAKPDSWADRFKSSLVGGNPAPAPVTVAVTVTTYPAGATIVVDGVAAKAPQVYQWLPGTSHTLSVPSSQGNTTTRQLFTSWSNGGAQTQTIAAPATPVTFIASLKTQYALTLTAVPANGGTVRANVASPDGFYDAGTSLGLGATAAKGYRFGGFTGSVTSASNPATLVLTGPASVTATFTKPGKSR